MPYIPKKYFVTDGRIFDENFRKLNIIKERLVEIQQKRLELLKDPVKHEAELKSIDALTDPCDHYLSEINDTVDDILTLLDDKVVNASKS